MASGWAIPTTHRPRRGWRRCIPMADTGSVKAESAAEAPSSAFTDPRPSRFFAHVEMSRQRLENHPGHADQSSHGRKKKGGGGQTPPDKAASGTGGVRDAIGGATTTDELNAAAAAEAKRLTGRDIAFDMTGSD